MDLPRKMEGIFRPLARDRFNFNTKVFKHFSQYIHFLHYANLTLGLCLPKTCSRSDLNLIAKNVSTFYQLPLSIDIDLCQTREDSYPLLFREKVSLLVLTLIVSLNSVALLTPKNNYLQNFNLVANFRKLVSPRPTRNFNLPILDGLKTLTMMFIIVSHAILFLPWVAQQYGLESTRISSNPLLIGAMLGPFTIDSFFLITGLESMLHLRKTCRKFSPIHQALGRVLRFAPVIGIMICIYIVTFSDHVRRMFGGPFWPYYSAAGSLSEVCGKNWLNHVLLIAHYFDSVDNRSLCLIEDWYLESDYIYALLLIPIVWPYLKGNQSMTIALAGMMVALGCFLNTVISVLLDVQNSWLPLNFEGEETFKYAFYVHTKPWGHLSGYFVGVLLAFTIEDPGKKLSRVIIAKKGSYL